MLKIGFSSGARARYTLKTDNKNIQEGKCDQNYFMILTNFFILKENGGKNKPISSRCRSNGAGPRLPTKYKPKRIVISDSEDSDNEKVLSAHKRYLRFILIEMIIFYYCVDF